MDSIGERICKARNHMNLSIKELAQKSNIDEEHLSLYENEIIEPKAPILTKLSNVLDVSIDYLLGITDLRKYDDATSEVDLKVSIKNRILDCALTDSEEELDSIAAYL